MTRRYASRRFARKFDRLRRYQEARRSTLRAIEQVCEIRGARVVELGAGTGVITRQLARRARWVAAFDRSPFMLDLAREHLGKPGLADCRLAIARHDRIPLPDRCADLVLAAWALDSVILDNDADVWQPAVDRIVDEMTRLTADGGTTLVVASPYCGARDYLAHLQHAHGFQRRLFKSVWRFPSKRAAREAILFFLRRAAWTDYAPHWPKDLVTLGGIWWRRRTINAGRAPRSARGDSAALPGARAA